MEEFATSAITEETGTSLQHAFAQIEPGVSIHYISAGSGARTVVLLHGFPQTWRAWRHVITHLIAVDAPLPGTAIFDQLRTSPRNWQFSFHNVRDLPELLVGGARRALFAMVLQLPHVESGSDHESRLSGLSGRLCCTGCHARGIRALSVLRPGLEGQSRSDRRERGSSEFLCSWQLARPARPLRWCVA